MIAALLSVGLQQSLPVQIAPAALAARANQPQVAIGADSTVYVAFGADDALYCSTSKDGGYTFSDPVKVGAAGKLSLGSRRGPRIAATKGGVVVSAVYGERGGGRDGDILSWRSRDDGKTWEGPTKVNDVSGAAREGLHAMGAGQGDAVVTAWLDLSQKGTRIMSSYSANGGRTWSKDSLVYESPDGSVCECCHPSVALGPSGEVGVMFRNSLRGNRDMYYAPSPDGGRTFMPAVKIGTRTWTLNACPMDGGALAYDGRGTAVSAWRSGETLYLGRGTTGTEIGPGRNPWITDSGNGPVMVWQTWQSGAIYLQFGTSVSTRKRLTEGGSDPVVASSPSAVFAAWRQSGDSPGIYVLRLPTSAVTYSP